MNELDRVTVGARAADALHRQNHGLAGQRIETMKEQPPQPGWRIQYGPDGVASGMVWVVPSWGPDA